MNVLGRKSSTSLQPFLFLPYKITTTSSLAPIFNYLGISRLSDSARAPQPPFKTSFSRVATLPRPTPTHSTPKDLPSFFCKNLFLENFSLFRSVGRGLPFGIVEIRQSGCQIPKNAVYLLRNLACMSLSF